MKIYTRKGDSGSTSLVGGTRVSKADPRLEAYGTIDELMAHLGYLYDILPLESGHRAELSEILSRVMDCGALMASEDTTLDKLPQITDENVAQMERWTDVLLDGLPELHYFTLPTGAPVVSYAHVCRTVARRAERRAVSLSQQGNVPPTLLSYLNRLSDYLYALGRRLSQELGATESKWIAHRH
ncbi:MAG: cob(I)yrinic acid a,c-diamide adenosyltransferase [Mucinivorans sp.]